MRPRDLFGVLAALVATIAFLLGCGASVVSQTTVAVSSTGVSSALVTSQTQPAPATSTTLQSPPASDAGVTEILAWAEGARARWDSIRVTGAYGAPGRLIAFSLEAAPEGVLCVAGSQTVALYGNVTWNYDSATNRATKTTKAAIDPSAQAALDQRMAEYAKANPALMRPDEARVINHPLDDVINPGYWVRTQLGTSAQAVKALGLETVNGRPAFHLSVTFPAETAKEKSWAVYVDQALGIIDRFVINPLPGQEGYEQVVDTASINLQFEPGHFAFSPPSSATVVEAGEPQ